ncbi:MAG: Alpha-amylase/alpha-mannosidase [Parcubacteria group bacterium GW2011_GWC2_39_11]|nr:MAG: Alpha-amylase/alpha-mannosidase [Parcubacteria group bacterium GW2011_GWC2_39_11]
MYWANFLHIYQPPTQKPYWIKRVSEESYWKIFRLFLENPRAKITMNISGILFELFEKNGQNDIIEMIKKLFDQGRLEVTGSAKYHPLLPFLPKQEIIRQIKLNEETLCHYLGKNFRPNGFFPPEMGFFPELSPILEELGYKWIIVDELSFPKQAAKQQYNRIYQASNAKDFSIFFRERKMSWVILSGQIGTGKLLLQSLGDRLKKNEYLITAMDGETFGHHRPGLEMLLFEIYNSNKIKNVKISELLDLFPQREEIEPQASTWALMEKDLEKKKPFARWQDDDNEIHNAQWELTKLAIDSVEKYESNSPEYQKARRSLDKALHSDQYWWASARPWWSIEMIELGAKELYESIISCPEMPEEIKEKAKKLYHKIVFTAFDWQRAGIIEKLSRSEDEEIRQRTDESLPRLPKKEVEKMVNRLKKEMKLVANRQEYERAAQVRDRIKELKKYSSEEKLEPSSEGNKEFNLNK